ncbi:hypothetical protein ABZY81_00645 [Streptomyces sp. NPDC006514]|uniref:hypothetical protein n=1 Tax=Streptomyces sp. NPDC006514 TaxID=3154308 RepID=UPI0033B125CB
MLAELAAAWADGMDADTVDRELSIACKGSALTHDAERGTSTPLLLARPRHASVRSLERYARPGVDSVARNVAERDPAARRRT